MDELAPEDHTYKVKKSSSIDTDQIGEKGLNFQQLIVKGHELIQKLGGQFGRVHRLLHAGGRVTNGTGISTTHTAW